MDVRCEKCGTEYEFDDERIGPTGVTVKCTACDHVFRVERRRGPSVPGAPSRDWLVRRLDGQIVAFKQLTTLQKWIVEGRIERSDEISKNGETWKRLGNISELEPFFAVFDKARALNELMSSGAIGEPPISLSGPDVLATSPLTADPVQDAAPAESFEGTDPNRPRTNPGRPSSARTRNRPPTMSRRTRSDARAGAGLTPDSTSGSYNRSSPEIRAPSLSNETHLAEPLNSRPIPNYAPPPNDGRSISQVRQELGPRGSSYGPPGQPGPYVPPLSPEPGPSHEAPAPYAYPSTPDPRPTSGERRVESTARAPIRSLSADGARGRYNRPRRGTRWVSFALALIAAGALGGASFALLGPKENPLRALLDASGFRAQAVEPQGERLDRAIRNFDLDTTASLTEAAADLAQVALARPTDPTPWALHALVLVTQAEKLRRQSDDDDREAARLKAELDAGRTPAQDPAVLVVQAAKKREDAARLMTLALDRAKAAQEKSSTSLLPRLALAEYYRIQQEEPAKIQVSLEDAKTAALAEGKSDAATMYSEAAGLLGDVENAPTPKLIEATKLLEEAITVRPSLIRARVLLARIFLARGLPDLAAAELSRALRLSPEHSEAKTLLERAQTPLAPKKAPEPEKKPEPPPSPEPEKKPAAATKKGGPRCDGFDECMRRATNLRERGDPWSALLAYERAADLRSNSAEASLGMAWTYLDMKKPEAALHLFSKAARLNSRMSEAHLGQAESHRALGQKPQAVAAYQRFLALSPSGPEANAARRNIEILSR